MSDENDGRVVVVSLGVDGPDRLLLRSVIQAEQGFVAQEDIGVCRDRAGLTDQLLLAAREVADASICQVRCVDSVECLVYLRCWESSTAKDTVPTG